MRDIPDLKYKVELFVGSKAIELQWNKDNQTWAPVHRPYVPHPFIKITHRSLCVYRDIYPTSDVRVEIQIKSGRLSWGQKDRNTKKIDIKKFFNEYWTSEQHNPTIPGRSFSQTSLLSTDGEAQWGLPLEIIVAIMNYVSLRALRFISLQPPIPSS